jgi:ABC-type multidrug transport system permease subunit
MDLLYKNNNICNKFFINKQEFGSFCKIIQRLYRCPKHVIILNILIISTSKNYLTIARAVYVSVDPFSLKSIFPRTVDRILHELIFATSVSLFLVLLLVWHGLYTAFDIDRHIQRSRSLKKKKCTIWKYETVHKIIIITLFLVYPVQVTFSYFRGARGVKANIVDGVLIAVMSVVISFVIVFFVYTCRFKMVISESNEAPIKNHIKDLRKTMYTQK